MKLLPRVVLVVTTFCTIAMVTVHSSTTVTLYTKTEQMEDTITEVEATDGDKYLLAVYQSSTGFINCYTVTDKDKLASLTPPVMEDASTVTFDLEKQMVRKLFRICSVQSTRLQAIKILAALTNTTAPDTDSSRPSLPIVSALGFRSWLIYPGTKWCGSKSSADSYDDLGRFNDTDICCRTHDYCEHFIPRWEKKYGYFNWYLWTISLCDCDSEFKTCLQNVSDPSEDTASSAVERIFFEILGVRCFTLDADGKAHLQ